LKLSIKAALYSALVFPGAGYFILQRNKQAIAFLLLTLVGLAGIAYEPVKQIPLVIQKTQLMAEKIAYGQLPMDLTVIVPMIRQDILNTLDSANPTLISNISIALGILWFIGVFDCYRSGRQKENDLSKKSEI